MLGLSMTEVVIILGLALLLLGPDQLPTLAKSLGKGLRELRKATDDLKSTFEQEMASIEQEPAPKPQPAPGAQPRMIAPVPNPDDPAAARASARLAASAPPPPSYEDPGAARAAARRSAAALKVVPDEKKP